MDLEQIARLAPQIGTSLICTQAVIPFFKHLIEKINAALEHLYTLEVDVTKFKNQLVACRALLDKACTKANTIVLVLKNFLESGHLALYPGRKEGILRKARDGDYSAMNAYLNQLKKYLEKCKACYKEFEDLKDRVGVESSSIMVDCEEKKWEASWGEMYRRIGSLTSSTGSAMQDGYFTRAITDAVGLISETGESIVSSTANVCGSAIDSVGRAVSKTGKRYIEIKKEFGKIQEDFQAMSERAKAIDDHMNELVEMMNHIVFESSIVMNDEGDFDTMETAFNILLKAIADTRERVYPLENYVSRAVHFVVILLWVGIFCLSAWYSYFVAVLLLIVFLFVWYLLYM